MKSKAEKLFDDKYYPLLKQMFIHGYNEQLLTISRELELQLYNTKERKKK